MTSARAEAALPWLFILGLLLIWEVACVAFAVPAFILPSPTLIAASLQKHASKAFARF